MNAMTPPVTPSGRLTTIERLIAVGQHVGGPPRPSWKQEFTMVSPALAEEILKLNTNNRRLRPTVIDRYAEIIKSGKWEITPQGIVISNTGVLLDGQHRLLAIIKADAAVPMFIWSNVEEEVYKVLDRGIARTTADALREDRDLTETAALLSDIYGRGPRTDAKVAVMLDVIREPFETLMTHGGKKKAKVVTSVAFRAAATVRILGNMEPLYVCDTYKAMSYNDQKAVGDGPAAVMRAILSGQLKSGYATNHDLLARGWIVFDKSKAAIKKVLVKDPSNQILEICEVLDDHLTPDANAVLMRDK